MNQAIRAIHDFVDRPVAWCGCSRKISTGKKRNQNAYREVTAHDAPWAILIAVPISAAIELCAEGFSVFAGQLYTMGASLGVVFVMMMVGVTADITEITVVWGKFGRRSAVAYVLVSTAVAAVVVHATNLFLSTDLSLL